MSFIGLHGVTENKTAVVAVDVVGNQSGVKSNTERIVVSDFNAKFLAYTAKILLIGVLLNRTSIFSVKDEF